MLKRKIALVITYDGTPFDGWQDNLSNISIEGALKKAFFTLYQTPFKLDAASRTDKGVHAKNQVVITELESDKIPLAKLKNALNSKLPGSLRVKEILEIEEHFHPSLSIEKKTYRYQVDTSMSFSPFHKNTHWHYPHLCDVNIMKKAAEQLIGKKDFSPFCTDAQKTLKNGFCDLLDLSIIQKGSVLYFEITADRFLYKMCRTLVGTLCYIGSGRLKEEALSQIFEKGNRMQLGPTAPPQGLFLTSLYYPKYASINALTVRKDP